MCLKGTFQCDMRCRPSHQLHKVPVFLCGGTVALNVSYQLTVCLCGCIEAEACLYLVVLQVSVDGLWHADDLYAVAMFLVVFRKNGGVGVGVITSDNDKGFDV